ncbi:MAG TPA: archease [Gemmatimonadaceae bacterium]|nr:archease [Gemmatimonadaceae bacterium]
MPKPTVRLDPQAAELKLVIRADSLEELFTEAARVVSREWGRTEGMPGEWTRVTLTARDRETLLVDWINELIGLSEVDQRAFNEVRGLRLAATSLEAEVRGRAVTGTVSPLKAATLHGLSLQREGTRWRAEVVIDV